jgi:uncharacterized protein YndB with AHSA1/START domain
MSASAVADVAAGTVHAAIEIAASPERVWRALSEPGELAAWWGSDDLYRTFDWKVDLRPGGAWSCQARSAGDQRRSTVRGEYRVVEPPRVLEYTWLASWDGFAPTVVRVELTPIPAGTRVKVVHSGLTGEEATRGTGNGWERVLSWLEAGVAGKEVGS